MTGPFRILNIPSRQTLVILVLALVQVETASAKGVTVEITVSRQSVPTPLSITDPDICGQFSIWSGPNSRYRIRGGDWQTDYSGIFIDFPGGPIDTIPDGLLAFDVEFHIADTPDEPRWDNTYRVRYAIDPDATGGYMFLPRGNPFIHHGVEDNWFRSTGSWEAAVRPLILAWLGSTRSPTYAD